MPAAPLSREERRQRREERRAKQRETNYGRAEKMHAARLAYEAAHPDAEPPPPPKPGHYVGCSGWYYWHWGQCFYPPDIARTAWFDHYAGTFRTVELNAPFYSWPTIATVETWVRQAARRRFIYTIKASELITHIKRFDGCKTLVRDFGLIADLLGPRMGCFLFQLPPSVHYSSVMLRKVLTSLDSRRRNVVEFRHRTWWREDVYRAFRDSGTIFCSTSGPRLPEELIRTADDVYVRFHGIKQWYRHDYSREELNTWSARIRSCGATRTWSYFNNDRECNAIRNALTLRQLLKRSGATPEAPLAVPRKPST